MRQGMEVGDRRVTSRQKTSKFVEFVAGRSLDPSRQKWQHADPAIHGGRRNGTNDFRGRPGRWAGDSPEDVPNQLNEGVAGISAKKLITPVTGKAHCHVLHPWALSMPTRNAVSSTLPATDPAESAKGPHVRATSTMDPITTSGVTSGTSAGSANFSPAFRT